MLNGERTKTKLPTHSEQFFLPIHTCIFCRYVFIYILKYAFRHIQIDIQIYTENAREMFSRHRLLQKHWGEMKTLGCRYNLVVNKFLLLGLEVAQCVPPCKVPLVFIPRSQSPEVCIDLCYPRASGDLPVWPFPRWCFSAWDHRQNVSTLLNSSFFWDSWEWE